MPAITAALKPLLDLRRAQAGGSYAEGGLYKEFADDPQKVGSVYDQMRNSLSGCRGTEEQQDSQLIQLKGFPTIC